jgi:hypothetical protein
MENEMRLAILFYVATTYVALACSPDPNRLNAQQAFVGVDGWQNGDVCNISSFPAPWNSLLGMQLGPGKGQFSWVYEDKQYGAAWIQIDGNGQGRIIFHYSNGKTIDGDNFTSAVEFLDANGSVVARVESIRGLNPDSEGDDIKVINSSIEQLSKVTALRFFHGRYDEQPDKQIWDAVLQAGQAACGEDCETF